MRTVVSIGVLLLMAAVIGMGQTVVQVEEPQFTAAAGLGFNGSGAPQLKGWGTFGTRMTAGTYSLVTLNMTSKVSTIGYDVAKTFYSSGPVSMFGLVGGGAAVGGGSVAATFDGGGGLKLSLSRVMRSAPPGWYAVGVVQVVQLNGAGVSPSFRFGLGFDFR